jgi:hypothetical protein
MISPLGTTQDVVCVLMLDKLVILNMCTPQGTDGFTAYVYAPVILTYSLNLYEE